MPEYNLPPKLIDIHNHTWKGMDEPAFLALMDELHIETMLMMGAGLDGMANERVHSVMGRHPGRFVGGCYLDPRDGRQAVAEMRHWCSEGMRVVKLFPNFGYSPDDDALRPFFDAVAGCKMAVLSHCGWLAPSPGMGYASYYATPGRFEKLIRLYPETIFIMAHMGGINGFLESIMLTTRTPNTYVDCSPGQGTWVLEHAWPMVCTIPPERLMWGADCMTLRETLARNRAALEARGFGPHFEKIFYGNARGILERIGALPVARAACP